MKTEDFVGVMDSFGYRTEKTNSELLFENRNVSPASWGYVDSVSNNSFEVQNVPEIVVEMVASYAATGIEERK